LRIARSPRCRSAQEPKIQSVKDRPVSRLYATPRWIAIACFAAIAVTYVVLRIPGLGVPLDRDEGAFGYIGQLINHGGLPYRDALDHKPPVAFYINAFALLLVPATEWGIHTFLLIYNFLTLICIFYIAKLYFESLRAGLWCAFAYAVFSASPAIQGFTASTEMWSLLPVSLSLLLAIRGIRQHSYLTLFASGVVGALACWTKQTAGTSVFFVFLWISTQAWRGAGKPRRIAGPIAWLAGAVALSSGIAAYFYAHGIFHEFVYWCFTYDLTYTSQALTGINTDLWQSQLMELAGGAFPLLAAAAVVVVWSIKRKREHAYFILGFLILSFLGTIPGFVYRHYFAQPAPAIALAGGYGFFVLLENFRTPKSRMLAGVFCGLAIIAAAAIGDRQYFLERDPNLISRLYYGPNPFPESKSLGAYIAQTTRPDDRIFVVGSEPQILFYAQRRSASAFVMIYPLLSSHPRYREFQTQMLAEIENNPPRKILGMVNIPYSLGWDQAADLDVIHKLESISQEHYAVDRVMLVAGTQGQWIDPSDPRLDQNNPFVVVFKTNAGVNAKDGSDQREPPADAAGH
jgi:Dolichyl-phosphate-mannose-protein mannosyltransferase